MATTRWMLGIRQSGLRGTIVRANLCVGATGLAAVITDGGNPSADTKNGTPSYTEANGWSTTSDSNFIYNQLNPSVSLSVNSAHLACYLGGTAGAEAAFPMGLTAISGNDFYITTAYTGFGQLLNIWGGTGRPVVADTDGRGFYVGSRTSGATNGVAVYRNGARTGTSTSVTGSPPNQASVGVPVLVVYNGTSIGHITKPCRGYQVGFGLTDRQVADFYVWWQLFNGPCGMNRNWQ
jgi:hypothetical protein